MIVPLDVTIWVIVLFFLEQERPIRSRSKRGIRDVSGGRSKTVNGYVNHQQHSSVVHLFGEGFKVSVGTKVGIELGWIGRPVSLQVNSRAEPHDKATKVLT